MCYIYRERESKRERESGSESESERERGGEREESVLCTYVSYTPSVYFISCIIRTLTKCAKKELPSHHTLSSCIGSILR